MTATTRLDEAELKVRLEAALLLEGALSSGRTVAGVAQVLSTIERAQQEFLLHWLTIAASTNTELAFQVGNRGPQALAVLGEEGTEAWVVQAMDVYDQSGLRAAMGVLNGLAEFASERETRRFGVALEEVMGVIEHFITGLSGRGLKVAAGAELYTDTETLFLPGLVNRFPTRQQNFQLYKTMAVHLWAQVFFGTWRRGAVAGAVAAFPVPERALRLLQALETLRLDACITRELPGVGREMAALRAALGQSRLAAAWQAAAAALAAPGAGLEDSVELLGQLWDRATTPPECCYQGLLRPELVEGVMAARIDRERRALRVALIRLRDEARKERPAAPEPGAEQGAEAAQFRLQPAPDTDGAGLELWLDDKPIAPPDEVRTLIGSIVLDLGAIPDEYLYAAGAGEYRVSEELESSRRAADGWWGATQEAGAFYYNEWDVERRHYRKNWCLLRELSVHPQPSDFVVAALQKYRGLVKSVRRTFEVLRGEDKLLKRQVDGDDVDIDAMVDAYADIHAGHEMPTGLYTRMRKLERDIAVMVMVDMSGSTKGWINDAEREALVLLCEALESLGDRYAVYGFSGMTRKRCEVYRVKRFDEPYSELVKQRIAGIAPKDYTRMGVAIRHLSGLLNAVEARTRVLVTLSDGKPEDLDGYRGAYGIEDTRQALLEARRDGIHAYCITLDTEARDYLPHMYGPAGYTVIDDVTKLPIKVSDIYRRLTT